MTVGWSPGCRDSFMRRDSGRHGAGTPQWTSSGQWSPSNPTIDAFSPHCATYGHSVYNRHASTDPPYSTGSFETAEELGTFQWSQFIKFPFRVRAKGCELIKFKGKACPEFNLASLLFLPFTLGTRQKSEHIQVQRWKVTHKIGPKPEPSGFFL